MQRTLLFFDGHCNLCNSTVDFVLRHDRANTIFVASLQGKTAAEVLHDDQRHGNDSVVLWHNGRAHVASSAVLHTARLMGFPWSMVVVFFVIPPFLRNAVYRFIARNRYHWFGERDSCRMPTPEEKERFLP